MRAPDGADLAAASSAGVEKVGAIGLQPADPDASRHLQPLEHRTTVRVDAADLAFVGLPRRMPELAIDPGNTGDEAVRLDGAPDGARLGVDLVDLALAVLPHPQAS